MAKKFCLFHRFLLPCFLGVNCAVPLILGVDDPLFLIDVEGSMVEARSFPNEKRAKGSCSIDVATEKKLILWFRS